MTFQSQIANLKSALARKEGETETKQSKISGSPYGIRGSTFQSTSQERVMLPEISSQREPMGDVGNIEVMFCNQLIVTKMNKSLAQNLMCILMVVAIFSKLNNFSSIYKNMPFPYNTFQKCSQRGLNSPHAFEVKKDNLRCCD